MILTRGKLTTKITEWAEGQIKFVFFVQFVFFVVNSPALVSSAKVWQKATTHI
jgi:hypothetical protein